MGMPVETLAASRTEIIASSFPEMVAKVEPHDQLVGEKIISSPVARTRVWPWVGLAVGSFLSLLAFLLPSGSQWSPAAATHSAKPFAIKDVQLGWRVVGENPQGQETWDAQPVGDKFAIEVTEISNDNDGLIPIKVIQIVPPKPFNPNPRSN